MVEHTGAAGNSLMSIVLVDADVSLETPDHRCYECPKLSEKSGHEFVDAWMEKNKTSTGPSSTVVGNRSDIGSEA